MVLWVSADVCSLHVLPALVLNCIGVNIDACTSVCCLHVMDLKCLSTLFQRPFSTSSNFARVLFAQRND